jgi:hypothetical protein
LLVLDPADSERPKPSSNAKPIPAHLNTNTADLTDKHRPDGVPEKGEPFHDPNSLQKWEEFNRIDAWVPNEFQQKVDLFKSEKIWFYMGKTSTEAKAQYTEDLRNLRHNVKANFLDSVKPPAPAPSLLHRSHYPKTPAYYVPPAGGFNYQAYNSAMGVQRNNHHIQAQSGGNPHRPEKPYQYKPKPDPTYQHAYQAQLLQGRKHYPSTMQGKATSYTPVQGQSSASQTPQTNNNSNRLYQHPASKPQNSPPQPSAATIRHVDPNISKTQSPYQYYHQYYQPRSTQSNNPLQNPYQQPSNSPELRRRILPPGTQGHSSGKAGSNTSNIEDYVKHLKQYPYLLNCYLRRPKCYVSPYANGGGFTAEWDPSKVSEQTNRDVISMISSTTHTNSQHAQSASQNDPTPQGLGIRDASSTPLRSMSGLQFQTAQQFQNDVARLQSTSNGQKFDKFDAFIQRLNAIRQQDPNWRPPSTPSSYSADLPQLDTQVDNPSQNSSTIVRSVTPPGEPNSKGHGLASSVAIRHDCASPPRPEYSPLSDAGCTPLHLQASSSVGTLTSNGAETWRYSQQ